MSLYVKGLQNCRQSKFSRLVNLQFYVVNQYSMESCIRSTPAVMQTFSLQRFIPCLWNVVILTNGHTKAEGCAGRFGVL